MASRGLLFGIGLLIILTLYNTGLLRGIVRSRQAVARGRPSVKSCVCGPGQTVHTDYEAKPTPKSRFGVHVDAIDDPVSTGC